MQPTSTQKCAWLARHPRWTFHFTPTSRSWANVVESFFRLAYPSPPATRCLPLARRSLQAAINRYLKEHNRKALPLDG